MMYWGTNRLKHYFLYWFCRYHLEPCADGENNEFVIIRFTAGPPYEDIAFKILNKEWDKHPKAGFLRVFDRGVLQVNFNFKRVFYRR